MHEAVDATPYLLTEGKVSMYHSYRPKHNPMAVFFAIFWRKMVESEGIKRGRRGMQSRLLYEGNQAGGGLAGKQGFEP